jgi:hypothetical protein
LLPSLENLVGPRAIALAPLLLPHSALLGF